MVALKILSCASQSRGPDWCPNCLQTERSKRGPNDMGNEAGVAGLPTLKGEGPRLDCAKRVSEYLLENPDATWKGIYRDVDNHYCSYASMRGAVGPYLSV